MTPSRIFQEIRRQRKVMAVYKRYRLAPIAVPVDSAADRDLLADPKAELVGVYGKRATQEQIAEDLRA